MLQTVCKEHEYIVVGFSSTSISNTVYYMQCKNCGLSMPEDGKQKKLSTDQDTPIQKIDSLLKGHKYN